MAKTEKTTDMTNNNGEKLKALKLTMDKLGKDYGKGSVMMLGDKAQITQEVISTGSIGLDVALYIGRYQASPVQSPPCNYFLPVQIRLPHFCHPVSARNFG